MTTAMPLNSPCRYDSAIQPNRIAHGGHGDGDGHDTQIPRRGVAGALVGVRPRWFDTCRAPGTVYAYRPAAMYGGITQTITGPTLEVAVGRSESIPTGGPLASCPRRGKCLRARFGPPAKEIDCVCICRSPLEAGRPEKGYARPPRHAPVGRSARYASRQYRFPPHGRLLARPGGA